MSATKPHKLLSVDSRIQKLELHVQALMTELHLARYEQRRDALTDPLTGLGNRQALENAFSEAQAAAAKGAVPPALLLMNLDGFRALKNSAGHAAADQILITVAMRIRSAVREDDVVTRLGGDEFAVLLPATAQSRAAARREPHPGRAGTEHRPWEQQHPLRRQRRPAHRGAASQHRGPSPRGRSGHGRVQE